MANPSSAAKYQLFTITKNNKTFPLQSKVVRFDYYESLLSPNITATIIFVDSGLVEKGDEQVNYDIMLFQLLVMYPKKLNLKYHRHLEH